MSTLALRLCAQLDATRQLRDKQLPQALSQVRKVHQTLCAAVHDSVVVAGLPSVELPYDLFLYVAETAAFLGEWDVVKKCCESLSAHHPTTPALTCRFLFCQCMLHTRDASGQVGERLVDKVQTAVAKALKGMQLALQDKEHHSHLVVRGSEHCWNAVRVLYANGTSGVLLNTLKEVNSGLEAVQHKDWGKRVTWLLRQAVAEIASGKDPKPTVANAVSICDKNGLDHLKRPLKRVQMAMKIEGSKGAAPGVMRGIAACQAVYSRLGDEKEQATDLQAAYQDLASSTLVGASLGKRVASKTTPKDEPTKDTKGGKGAAPPAVTETDIRDKEEVLAEVGLLAALHPLPPLAENPLSDETPARSQRYRLFTLYSNAVKASEESGAAELTKDHFHASPSEMYPIALENMLPAIAQDTSKKAANSPSLRARVLAEYTAAVLIVKRAGGYDVQREKYANRCTPEMTQQIVLGVRHLVKALESAVRTNDIHLTQQGCVLVWNMVLPLLNPETRGLVSKSLQSTLHILDSMSSNLHRLKVHLLCELAYCDVADEYLAKAKVRVTQALCENYVVDEEEASLYGIPRPLDRFLEPLQQRLELKADMYYVPDTRTAKDEAERERITREEVILLLDRAADTKAVGSLVHMLQNAHTLMLGTEPPLDWVTPPEPEAVPVDPKGKKRKSITDVPPPAPSLDAAEENRRHEVLRARGALWAQLLNTAWKNPHPKLIAIVRSTAPKLMCRKWGHHAERQLRIDQLQACLTCADTHVVELKAKGYSIGQRVFRSAAGDPLEEHEAVSLRAEVLSTQDAINEQFTLALDFAPAVLAQGDSWLVANIAVMYLNWHTPLIAAKDFIHSYTLETHVQKDGTSGLLALTLGAGMVSTSVTPDSHAEAAGLKKGMCITKINGEAVTTNESYEAALRASPKVVVNVTAKAPLEYPVKAVLEKLLEVLCLPGMGIVPQCSPYEADLLAQAGRALSLSFLQEYVQTKLPLGTSEEELMATNISMFPHADAASPLLKQSEETCDKVIQALPAPMDAKVLYFLLGATRRLQAPAPKLPDVPVKPDYGTPQERVLASLELLKHVSGNEKDRVLKDALSELQKDPNIELCARLGEKALGEDGFPKHAVQICKIAKDLEAQGELGIKGAVVSKHAAEPAAADKKKAPEKGAKRVSLTPEMVEVIPPPPPSETHYTWHSHVLQHSGKAILGLIDPRTQENTTQTELRKRALSDFSLAALFALKGRKEECPLNLIRAMKLYHMAAQAFAGAVVTRAVMQTSLVELVHKGIPGLKIAELSDVDISVVLDLHLILIQTCRDRADYDRGLFVMRQAFELLPRSYHKPLWEADVQFRCKMGQSAIKIRDKLRAVKGYDAPTQARAWVMFSRCIDNETDQLHALQQAVEALADEPEAQASALTRLAVWMFTHRRPTAECRDVLLYAADLIETTIESGREDDGKSLKDTRSQGSLGASNTKTANAPSERSQNQMRPNATATATGGSKSMTGTSSCEVRIEGPTVPQLLSLGVIFTHLAILGGSGNQSFYMYLQLAVMHFGQSLTLTQRELERRAAVVQQKTPEDTSIPVLKVPTDLTKWIGWETPKDVVSYLQAERCERLLGPGSVEDAPYLYSVLRTLAKILTEHSLPLQLLVVLGIESVVLSFMSMHHVAQTHSLSRNLQEKMLAHQELSLEPASTIIQGSTVLGELSEGARRELLEDLREVLLNTPVPHEHEVTSGVELIECGSPSVYTSWISEGEVLIRSGMYGHAKTLIEEALLHADAWRHRKDMATCKVLLAEIALHEGRIKTASDLVAESVDDPRTATVLSADMVVKVLLLRTQLFLLQGVSTETILTIPSTASASLSCPEDPSREAHFAPHKGKFLCSFVSLLLDYYDAKVYNPYLPEVMVVFMKEALQKAGRCLGVRGAGAVRLLLLTVRVQEKVLSAMPLSQNVVRLRALRGVLNEQVQILRGCVATSSSFASFTSPYPTELRNLRITQPTTKLLAESQVLLAKNILRRYTVNTLLKRMHVLRPARSVGSTATDATSLHVRGFLESDIGLRFMTMTKKQRNTRTKLRELEHRRTVVRERIAAEAPEDTPPSPHTLDRLALEEVPSDTNSDTSDSDSGTECASTEQSALHIDNIERDYTITPHQAHSVCDTAMSGLNPGSLAHCKASLVAGECLRASIEAGIVGKKLAMLGRKGLDLHDAPTAVDDLWVEASVEVEVVATEAVEVEKKGAKKGKAVEEEVVPAVPKECLEGADGSDPQLLCKKLLVDALEGLMACDKWSLASDAAHELSRIYLTTGDTQKAARYLALAQSLSASAFTLSVFLAVSHPQNRERILLKHLESFDSDPSNAKFFALSQLAFDTSVVYRSLKTWKSADPMLPTEKLPPNTSVVVLHIGRRRQHLYAVHHKQGKAPLVNRCPFVQEELDALEAAYTQLEADKLSFLGGDVIRNGFTDAIASQHASLLHTLHHLLHPALSSFTPYLQDNIVLCAPHSLQQYPLECLGVFSNAKQVVRDISAFHYESRLEATEGQPKAKTDSVRYAVDVFDETAGKLMGALVGDKAALPNSWIGVSGRTTGETLTAASGVQIGNQLKSAASLAVFLSPGRLCSAMPAADVAGLELSGAKCLLLADRSLHPASFKRTSHNDSKLPEAMLATEAPVPINHLLLARGVPALLSSSGAWSTEAVVVNVKAILTAFEKGASVAETLHAMRKASVVVEEGEEKQTQSGPLMV